MTIFLSKVGFQADQGSLQKLGNDLDNTLKGKSQIKIKAQLDLVQAERNLEDLKRKADKAMKLGDLSSWEKARVLVLDATSQVDKCKKSLVDVNKEMGNIDEKVPAWKRLGSAIAGALAIGTVVNWGKKIFDAASQVQQLQISFGTMLGSAEKGKKLFADLQEFARVTPFNATDIQKSTQLLLAFGYDAQKIIPTMRAVGEAVSAAGGSGDTLLNVSRALGQIQTKGKLSAEEVNQLAENGIGAWKLLSEGMGKSEAQLMKMAADGKLLANDVLPILTAQMEKTFGGNMEKQAKTLNGRLSNIQDTFTQTIASIGTTVNPVFNTILDLIGGLVNALGYVTKQFPVLTGVVVSLIGALGLLGGGIAILGPIFTALGTALAGIGITTLLGPIGLVIAAVTALGLGIAATTDIMRESDPVVSDLKDRLSELESKQREIEQAYRDGTITAEEYRAKNEEIQKQIDANKTSTEEYNKGLAIVKDSHLSYIEKIKEINAMKLDPTAYELLIRENKKLQDELIHSINLQRLLMKSQAEQGLRDAQNALPITSGQGGLSTNLGPSKSQLDNLEKAVKIYNDFPDEDKKLKNQIDDIQKITVEGDKLIKQETEKKKKIEGTTGATGGAKKENEALKKSVDKISDSYKILENDLKKVQSTHEKEIEAQKKWNQSLREEQEKTEKSIVKVRDEYQKTIDKLNEDSKKQSIDSTGDYYRNLLEEKKKLEKEAVDEAVRLSNEGASAGGTSHFNDYQGPTIDPNKDAMAYIKYVETYGASTQLISRKLLTDIETINAQIKEAQSSGILDQNTKSREDQRNSLTDQEKQRFDFMQKYGQIQIDLANKTSEATDKFAQSRSQIEGMQQVIEFFKGTDLRGAKLDNTAEGLKKKFNNDETSNLIDKLLTEKKNLISITDDRIAAESRVHDEAMRLATVYHNAEVEMVRARKAEYDELIAKITQAIQAADALKSAQSSVGISTTSSGKGYAEGGYTGDGGKYDVAGVVHKGEYVIPQNVLANIRSNLPSFVPSLEAMRTGNSANTSNIDQSRHISITGPIRVEREVDFERLLSRAAWRNR